MDLHFQVDKQLYDTLRDESRSFPIILAILELPKERTQWIERTPEKPGTAPLSLVGIP